MKKYLLVLVVLAVGLAGCAERAVAPEPVSGKTEEAKFVDEMVAKANGDAANLSAEEREKMDKITRGNTDVVIKSSKK